MIYENRLGRLAAAVAIIDITEVAVPGVDPDRIGSAHSSFEYQKKQSGGTKVTKYVSMAILLVSCAVAMAAAIGNLIDVKVPTFIDGTNPSTEDVRNAIMAGCKRKAWIPVVDEDGNITCSITVRAEHFAEVEIPYSADKYSIVDRKSVV